MNTYVIPSPASIASTPPGAGGVDQDAARDDRMQLLDAVLLQARSNPQSAC
jgi:hypothetical protein